MADLNDRGQIMLVSAFILAVSFVAVAVMLNSVIYTENLATRGPDARGEDAIEFRTDMEVGAERLIEYVNRNHSTFPDIYADFNKSIGSVTNGTAPVAAINGQYANVSVVSVTGGTRIGQFDASRNFTSADGDEEWDLATAIEGTRSFSINVTDSSALVENSSGNDPFSVTVDDSSTEWEVEIAFNSTNTESVVNVVGGGLCTGSPTPEIDLTAGLVDGEPCQALDFGAGTTTPYTIEFDEADQIQGNFSLVVDSMNYDSSNYDADRDTPFATPAIYTATIHVRHESANHIYETDVRARPGESDV